MRSGCASGPPDAGYGLVAEPAIALYDVDGSDGVAHAFDHFAAAARAVGVLGGMAGNVSDVDVVQALGVGGGLGAIEGRDRSRRQILQQVLGMELREVDRHVRPQLSLD